MANKDTRPIFQSEKDKLFIGNWQDSDTAHMCNPRAKRNEKIKKAREVNNEYYRLKKCKYDTR